MNNTIRFFSAVLSALMLSTSLAACADNNTDPTNDTTADTTSSATTTTEIQRMHAQRQKTTSQTISPLMAAQSAGSVIPNSP